MRDNTLDAVVRELGSRLTRGQAIVKDPNSSYPSAMAGVSHYAWRSVADAGSRHRNAEINLTRRNTCISLVTSY